MVIPDKYYSSKENHSFACMNSSFFAFAKTMLRSLLILFHTLRREEKKKKDSIFDVNATSLFQGSPSPPAAPLLVITETGGIPEGKTRGVICQPFDNWRRRRSRHYFPHLAVPRFAPFGYFSSTSWGILGQHASCILQTVTLRKKYKNTQPLTSDPIRLNLF